MNIIKAVWEVARTAMAMESPYKNRWCYENGLMLLALQNFAKAAGNSEINDFVNNKIDNLVNDKGEIALYNAGDYNIDQINAGKILFDRFKETGDNRYFSAINSVMEQLYTHPRTEFGGFWHKKIYPYQVWLDGIYMEAPFYAQYSAYIGKQESFDDIANQITGTYERTLDVKTGLLYHGWDERRVQSWANKETGCSPNFWGRAIGWYTMALVDTLSYFPVNHPKRGRLLEIINSLFAALRTYQDEKTGMWYQVIDAAGRAGNYLETSATSMFAYAFGKAVSEGYINSSYLQPAIKAYEGIIEKYVRTDNDGITHLGGICKVAGLGGNPYRDGSLEYYISEPVVEDDYKGTGPFILAGTVLMNR